MKHSRDPLSGALQQWRVNPPPDPNFRPAVWQRMGRRPRESWAAYVRSHLLGWSVVTVVAAVAAGWTGHATAQARVAAAREAMVVAYLVDLDPRVQARLRP